VSLERFLVAQERDYVQALAELRDGAKRTHWIWYVLPQCAGLGMSDMSRRYAIQDLDEARAYLAHPVLGARLVECMDAALTHGTRSAREIMGSPDDLKLRSCATLFAMVAEPGSVFERVLARFFGGAGDARTVELMGKGEGPAG
jgi:uncharacterized protein (DUF1810 family)